MNNLIYRIKLEPEAKIDIQDAIDYLPMDGILRSITNHIISSLGLGGNYFLINNC
jgi:hypothetical protein